MTRPIVPSSSRMTPRTTYSPGGSAPIGAAPPHSFLPNPPRRRQPRPADWGIGMTVWVAAVNVSDRAIVMVSDTMASLAGGAFCPDETLLKVANVHRAWSAMYAGNDITPVYPILPRVRTEVSPQGWSSSPAIGVSVVQAAFARAYRAERTARAEQLLLGPYGLDMATFNARGLKIFGESGAAIMRDRIERVEFDCEFLVCGFDEASRPHIFTVGNRGVVSDYDTRGYWAIGSGYLNALGALARTRLWSFNGRI